jgi:hypothetical protein
MLRFCPCQLAEDKIWLSFKPLEKPGWNVHRPCIPRSKGIVALHGRQHEKIAPVLLSFLTQAVTALVQHDASWGEYAAQHLEGLSSAFGGCPRRVPAISRQWHMWFIMIARTHCHRPGHPSAQLISSPYY